MCPDSPGAAGGAAHPPTDSFSLFDICVAGTTGAMFLFGIAVGAVVSPAPVTDETIFCPRFPQRQPIDTS